VDVSFIDSHNGEQHKDNCVMPIKRRQPWLDFLRGFAMLLVIWGHIAKTERMFYVFTGPFKMPLFFAITGYVFNDGGGNGSDF